MNLQVALEDSVRMMAYTTSKTMSVCLGICMDVKVRIRNVGSASSEAALNYLSGDGPE